MEKIIIKNESELPMTKVLNLVDEVMKMGRISNNNKQYCYLTVFEIEGLKYQIVTDLRKKSDVFTIYKQSW